MEVATDEVPNVKPNIKKRIPSANFNSKKIKTILTNRQTRD